MSDKKNITELSVVELKALAFDIDNNIKRMQQDYVQVVQVLQSKAETEAVPKMKDSTTDTDG